MKKLRILLAEDHRVVREGLAMLINAQPDMEVVAEAGNGREACEKACALRPAVVVLDLSMPEWSGLQAAAVLQEQQPTIKVLALTIHEDEGYLRELLRANIAGYVLKRSAADELIAAIRTVARGGVHFDATLAGQALVSQAGAAAAKGESQTGRLSAREKTVLTLIARGYSNKEIAGQLNLSVKTIETYKIRIGDKLQLHSRAAMVQYALRQGWLSEGPASLGTLPGYRPSPARPDQGRS